MAKTKPVVSIIVLIYNSKRYIPQCFESIFNQKYRNIEVLPLINGNDDGSKDMLQNKYGHYKRVRIIDPGKNLWFSKGNNYAITQSTGTYVLTLNDDTILEPDFIEKLVEVMESDKKLGSATGKLLHYKFDIDSKTRILDSTGIEIFKTRRVIDRGQWEEDRGQYDEETEVFGASGAAALFRRSALDEVKVPKKEGGYEYFDETFVAYKEDVDLAWRLQLAGYKCRYVPEAIIYHGRSVGRAWPTQFIRFILNRRQQSRRVRKLSFKNHYLMMVKNEIPQVFWRHFLFILIREILLFSYTIIFEQFQIWALRDFLKELPDTKRKRGYVMRSVRVKTADIIDLFHQNY